MMGLEKEWKDCDWVERRDKVSAIRMYFFSSKERLKENKLLAETVVPILELGERLCIRWCDLDNIRREQETRIAELEAQLKEARLAQTD